MAQFLAELAVPLAGGLFVAACEINRHLNATGGSMWWFKVRLAVQSRLDRRRDAKVWGRR